MKPDWKDTTREDRFVFELVDPNDLDATRGYLDGVVAGESSLSFGYYSDTRVSGTLKVVDGNYIENSLIRIHHYVDEWDYHDVLGTFFAASAKPAYSRGVEAVEFELASMLAKVSDDKWAWNYAIAQSAYARDVLADMFRLYAVDHSILSACNDTRYSSPKVFEIGDGVLSSFFEVADAMAARLDVDGRGTLIVEPYVLPSSREPVFSYDAEAPDSIMYGDLVKTTDYFSVPNRAVVVHKEGDAEVSAYADVPSTSRMAAGRRGRRVTEVYNLDGLSPATYAQAAQIAKARLDGIDDEQIELEFDALYVPMRTGDVSTVSHNGATYKAMLKSRDLSLAPGMPTSNTFKVV